MLVAGVDLSGAPGSRNFSYVAWLDVHQNRFLLDAYVPSPSTPLPEPPVGAAVACIGFDCPQSLPPFGAARRVCDAQAQTATKRIPSSREALKSFIAYRGLIELGIDIFWNSFENGSAAVYGMPQPGGSGGAACADGVNPRR